MGKGTRIGQQLLLYFPNTPERQAREDPILCVLNKQPCEKFLHWNRGCLAKSVFKCVLLNPFFSY